MRINHNLASLNIYRNYVKDLEGQSSALGKISSGVKINSARDDAHALARSERLRMQISSTQAVSRNVQDGISLVQTAEVGVNSIADSLQRMRELIVSADSGKSGSDKKIIQEELNQLKRAIDGFTVSTDFNGKKMLNANDTIKMSVGVNSGEVVNIPVQDLSTTQIGSAALKVNDIDLTLGTTVDDAIKSIDASLKQVNDLRSKYGAISNRFETAYNDLNEVAQKVQGVESSIRDADIAEEMMKYTKDSLLVNASQAMLVQTNKFPQEILRILENVR
ncbi:MAG: flagellin [Clostridiaceae bacterium]